MKRLRSRHRHLSDQLLAGFGFLLLLAGVTTLGVNYRLYENELARETQGKAASLARSLQISTRIVAQAEQTEQLQQIALNYGALPGVLEVALLDPQGRTIAHSRLEERDVYGTAHPELQAAIAQVRQTGAEAYLRLVLHNQPVVVYLLPFNADLFGQTRSPGLAIAVLDLNQIQQQSWHSFLVATTTMLGVTLGMLVVMGLLLQRMLLNPLTQLTREVANSDSTGTFLIPQSLPNQELRQLAETFDQVFRERYQAEQTLQLRATWLRKQGSVLSRLARHRAINQGELLVAMQQVTEATAETLMVDRVSVWLYNEDKTRLDCLDLFQYCPVKPDQSQHSTGLTLTVAEFPTYFRAIEIEDKPITAHDAQTDPRTSEFTATYLRPLNIVSMLDVPIRASGQMVGVLCLEQIDEMRVWTPEDENFGRSVGDLVTLAIEAHDRRQAEEAIAASEKQFRTLVSNIPGAVYRCHFDADWTMDFVSDAITNITGYSAVDFLQNRVRSFASIIHPRDVAGVQECIQQAIDRKTAYVLEYRILHADQSTRWVSEKGRGIFADSGELLYLDGAIFDVTERKQAEIQIMQQADELEQTLMELRRTQTQVIQSEKLSSLGQMVAGVAHEINNPINFIHGNIKHADVDVNNLLELLELYQHYYPNPVDEIQTRAEEIDLEFITEDLPKVISSMQLGSERIREIVRSLRTFSRLDEAEYKTANLHEGIDSTLLILRHRLKAKANLPEIQIIKEYGDIPDIECYPGQLNQVFMNILSNAIDALEEKVERSPLAPTGNGQKTGERNGNGNEHSPAPGVLLPVLSTPKASPLWVRIRTERWDGNRVQIRIADNGNGMSQVVQAKLFDPFFTTKAVGKGTGLGLSISYQVIEKHTGRLTCHSTPGQGTEFVIELPIQVPVATAAPAST